MRIERKSHCKVNLLLNILGKRQDGFHELESLMHPVWVCDVIEFERTGSSIDLRCSDVNLPANSSNLVYRAAEAYLREAGLRTGVRIFLQKNLPLAAGLGGGSGNAACTLLAMNDLFEGALSSERLVALSATLGSDVAFFMQSAPALAFGRGERIEQIAPLTALKNAAFLLVHPGFGISTPWAYKELARYPDALNGRAGRARELADALTSGTLEQAAPLFYNSLEAPALEKYPVLALYQEFFRERGAVTLMSGSGSSTFAITSSLDAARKLGDDFCAQFGKQGWMAICPCAGQNI